MNIIEHEDQPSIGDSFIEVDEFGLTKILKRMGEFKDIYLELSIKRSETDRFLEINFGGVTASYGDFISITDDGEMRVLEADQFNIAVDLFRDTKTK